MKDKSCPTCHSTDITQCYMAFSGDKYECLACGKMWGWYYDRNKPENKLKSDPHN